MTATELVMIRAAKKGDVAGVRRQLAAGTDVNCRDCRGITPLNHAAETGQVEVVEHLLTVDGVDVNSKCNQGCSPLYMAAAKGCLSVVRLLLKVPVVDVNAVRKDIGWTPLGAAAMGGHLEVVKLLLAVPEVDINRLDNNGKTAAHGAWIQGHLKVEGLIKAAALQQAARDGDVAVARRLLAHGTTDVNCKDSKGHTPLISAARYGHVAMVKLLLGVDDVDVNAANNFGWTPLYWAARDGQLAVVRLLLAVADIDVTAESKQGETAEQVARDRDHGALAQLIADAAANHQREYPAAVSASVGPEEEEEDEDEEKKDDDDEDYDNEEEEDGYSSDSCYYQGTPEESQLALPRAVLSPAHAVTPHQRVRPRVQSNERTLHKKRLSSEFDAGSTSPEKRQRIEEEASTAGEPVMSSSGTSSGPSALSSATNTRADYVWAPARVPVVDAAAASAEVIDLTDSEPDILRTNNQQSSPGIDSCGLDVVQLEKKQCPVAPVFMCTAGEAAVLVQGRSDTTVRSRAVRDANEEEADALLIPGTPHPAASYQLADPELVLPELDRLGLRFDAATGGVTGTPSEVQLQLEPLDIRVRAVNAFGTSDECGTLRICVTSDLGAALRERGLQEHEEAVLTALAPTLGELATMVETDSASVQSWLKRRNIALMCVEVKLGAALMELASDPHRGNNSGAGSTAARRRATTGEQQGAVASGCVLCRHCPPATEYNPPPFPARVAASGNSRPTTRWWW